jgi:hypothetical protein
MHPDEKSLADSHPRAEQLSANSSSRWSSDSAILLYVALATVVIHLLTGGRYGFHRDELATLDGSRHLSWGYVAYPPLIPFFARASLILFGTSLTGFRFFAALAEAVAVVMTGLMTRELGGRRGAQLVAAFAAVPFCLAGGALMQYVSFDYLFWVLTAYFVVRLLKSENPRWWIAVGCAIGFGMLSKYSMPFLVAGLFVGVLLTPVRRHLSSRWLWLGVAASLLIFLPNLLWQIHHNFVSIDFLRYIHARDIRWGRTKYFLPGQVELTLFAFPLALMGLYFHFFSRIAKRFRVLGWMYIIPLLLFVLAKGRFYYLAGNYPMLYAGGAVWGEQWLASLPRALANTIRVSAWTALLANILIFSALFLPIAPINSRWWNTAVKMNGDFREEIGWPELVETIAKVRDSLPAQDRAHLGILAGNYGEAGAIDLYGPRYGLPPAISGVNSFWFRGYGDPPPQTLIVLSVSRHFAEANFASCRVVAHTWNRYGVANEETTDHPDIYLCRDLRESWPVFWKDFRYYG